MKKPLKCIFNGVYNEKDDNSRDDVTTGYHNLKLCHDHLYFCCNRPFHYQCISNATYKTKYSYSMQSDFKAYKLVH